MHHRQAFGACKHESFYLKLNHLPLLFVMPHPQIGICYTVATQQQSFPPPALCCCKVFLLFLWPTVSTLQLEEFVVLHTALSAHSLSCMKGLPCF